MSPTIRLRTAQGAAAAQRASGKRSMPDQGLSATNKRPMLDPEAPLCTAESANKARQKEANSSSNGTDHQSQDESCTCGQEGSRRPYPRNGATYYIRHRATRKNLVVKEGQPTIQAHLNQAGCHWACVEADGWFGFRNTVSGLYITINDEGSFQTKTSTHDNRGYFVVKPMPMGGCEILVLHNLKLRPVAVGDQGSADKASSLTMTGGMGDAWDIIYTNET